MSHSNGWRKPLRNGGAVILLMTAGQLMAAGASPFHTNSSADTPKNLIGKLTTGKVNLMCCKGTPALCSISVAPSCAVGEKAFKTMHFDGFNDTGLLLVRDEKDKALLTCSGVLVGPPNNAGETVALTSRHCVGNVEDKNNQLVFVPFANATYYLLVPKVDLESEKKLVSRCIPAISTDCGFLVGKATKNDVVAWPPAKSVLIDHANFYSRDLALVNFKFQGGKPIRFAKIVDSGDLVINTSKDILKSRLAAITQIGYGIYDDAAANNDIAQISGGHPNVNIDANLQALESGIMKLNHIQNPSFLNVTTPTGTKACNGDSGGPVFAGFQVGTESTSTQRPLLGIIAGGNKGNATGNCTASDWQAVQVFDAEAVKSICSSKFAGRIGACP